MKSQPKRQPKSSAKNEETSASPGKAAGQQRQKARAARGARRVPDAKAVLDEAFSGPVPTPEKYPALRELFNPRPWIRIDAQGTWIKRDHIVPLKITAPDGTPIRQPGIPLDAQQLRALGQYMARIDRQGRREGGLYTPLMLRPNPNDPEGKTYQVWDGEERWQAAQPEYADIEWLLSIVNPLSDWEVLRATWSLHSHEYRSDYERGVHLLNLKTMSGVGGQREAAWEQIADIVGMSHEKLRRLVKMLDLPAPILAHFQPPTSAKQRSEAFVFNEKHAQALLTLKRDEALQSQLVEEIKRERLSGHSAIERAQEYGAPAKTKTAGPAPTSAWPPGAMHPVKVVPQQDSVHDLLRSVVHSATLAQEQATLRQRTLSDQGLAFDAGEAKLVRRDFEQVQQLMENVLHIVGGKAQQPGQPTGHSPSSELTSDGE